MVVVIGGNEKNRHGIVLTKSTLAKRLGIQTGMSLMEARQLCPGLLVVPPRYDIFVRVCLRIGMISIMKNWIR